MKHTLTILVFSFLAFGLGWFVGNMRHLEGESRNIKPNTDSLEIVKTKETKKKTFRDYISDERFIRWAPNHSDTSRYMCEISLHEITALYWYHGQCAYDYFTYLHSDTTIEVLWSYRSDCMLNMDFLERSNGVAACPKPGDDFALLTLLNDTTLHVKYRFPEWTKRVNEIAGDSLFPSNYYLVKDELTERTQ